MSSMDYLATFSRNQIDAKKGQWCYVLGGFILINHCYVFGNPENKSNNADHKLWNNEQISKLVQNILEPLHEFYKPNLLFCSGYKCKYALASHA